MKNIKFLHHDKTPFFRLPIPFSLFRVPFLLSMLLFIIIALLACDSPNSVTAAAGGGEWLIPANEIKDGGPGRDGIPALANPKFVSAASAGYLRDNDLVVGINVDGEARAYPHSILDWHEIINDDIGNLKISITYCPLTGTGIGWDRQVGGKITTFGVSGLLYNTNLIPYDRATGSEWSQMKLQCVHGKLAGEKIKTHQVIETTWATWKRMAPKTMVVSSQTGYSRSYGNYPYGDYRTNNNSLVFPVSNHDGRLPRKDRVLGILVNGQTKAVPLKSFGSDVTLLQETFADAPIVIVGSRAKNFVVAFDRRIDGTTLEFIAIPDELPLVLKDNEGTLWTVFGTAVSGPRKGRTLKPLQGYMAYWFAWAAFWPATDLHN